MKNLRIHENLKTKEKQTFIENKKNRLISYRAYKFGIKREERKSHNNQYLNA